MSEIPVDVPVEYPEIDFAMDAVPNLHEVLADLRERLPIAPVRYHGATAYLIMRFGDLRSAMADDEAFPSWAAYARHTEPVMGRTIQCMGGDEHRRNRGLVSAAFRPRLMTEFVEAFLTPVAHQLVDAIVEGQTGSRGTADLVADYTTRYALVLFKTLSGASDCISLDVLNYSAWDFNICRRTNFTFQRPNEMHPLLQRQFQAELERLPKQRKRQRFLHHTCVN